MKIGISIDKHLLKRLDQRAKDEDRKRSAVITRAVKAYLAKK